MTLLRLSDDSEPLTVTGPIDKTLAEGLVGRVELRYDTFWAMPATVSPRGAMPRV